MKGKLRHKLVFGLLRYPFKWFFKLKYNFKSINYKLDKKPYLILSNHNTILDPFMVASSFNRPVYFVASSDIYQNKYGKLIKWLVNPIFKNKSVKEIGPIKDCIRICKDGGTVGIFPEGNRTYTGELCHIDEAIAKMAKMMKVDVVLYNIIGGYGIDPRWCFKGRRGKSYGYVREIISASDVKQMSVEELFQKIKEGLTVQAVPTSINYKGKNLALGLERVLYKCPICGAVQSIYTEKDYVHCTKCNLKVLYNKNLQFECDNPNFKFSYVHEWANFQLDWVKGFDINTEEEIYKDTLTLRKIEGKSKTDLLTGTLKLYVDRFEFSDENTKMIFKFDDIYSVTVLGKNKLNFYIDNDTYQIKGDKTLNTLKYMHMYYHIKNIKGGVNDDYFGI